MINPEDIIKAVEEEYHLPYGTIVAKGRTKVVAEARAKAVYLCREQTEYSYPELAELFFNRDHTTLMAAYNKYRRKIVTEKVITKYNEFING